MGTEELVKKEDGWWHPQGGLIEEVEPPAPQKIESHKAADYKEVLPFESFALSDEQGVVKLYFGLKNAKELLAPDAVTATFRVQALEVVARLSPSRIFRFHESILYEHVVPDKCKVKVKTDHILVTLLKANQAYWQQIGVNRKAIGPVRKSPPDFGHPTIVVAGGTSRPLS